MREPQSEEEEKEEESTVQMSADQTRKKLWGWIHAISVEPIMFLYMLAFMLTSVVEQAFFVSRACSVDLRLPANVCNHLEQREFQAEKEQVHAFYSGFIQYNNVAAHVVPVVLALFLGAWSDRHGGARKAPMLLGLTGKLFYSLMVVLNALQPSWPLYTVLYSATLPCALTGADLAIFMASFSYLADITSSQERTLRVTLLQVTYLVTIPTGVALGQMLYTATSRSVAAVFGVNALLVATALVYAMLRLKWRSAPGATSVMPLPLSRFFCDFFDRRHFTQSVRALVRRRPGHRRAFLFALLLAMALYTFIRDESHFMFLYTQLHFSWDTKTYSDFRTYQSGVYVLGTLLGLPLITKVFKLPDAAAVIIGAAAHASARIVFVLAEVPWLLYAGASLAALGPVVAPVLRSMVSKVVPVRERGKVLAVLASADNAVPLFSGAIYSQVYRETLASFPGAVFVITFASQLIVILLMTGIYMSLGGRELEDGEEPPQSDPTDLGKDLNNPSSLSTAPTRQSSAEKLTA